MNSKQLVSKIKEFLYSDNEDIELSDEEVNSLDRVFRSYADGEIKNPRIEKWVLPELEVALDGKFPDWESNDRVAMQTIIPYLIMRRK